MENAPYTIQVSVTGEECEPIGEELLVPIRCSGFVLIAYNEENTMVAGHEISRTTLAKIFATDKDMTDVAKLALIYRAALGDKYDE